MLHKIRNLSGRRAMIAGGVVLAVGVWAAAVGAGWCALLRYDFATSDAAPGSQLVVWPTDSKLPRRDGQRTIVVFLHPKCPCSPATLTELERVFKLASAEGRQTRVLVVPVTPPDADTSWANTEVVRRAAQVAGAEICPDPGGFEAERFGARDSGTLLYFDADGRRRFSGGITIARGQEGLSASGAALANVMSHQLTVAPTSPAFGCRLFKPKTTGGSPTSPAVEEEASCVEATFIEL